MRFAPNPFVQRTRELRCGFQIERQRSRAADNRRSASHENGDLRVRGLEIARVSDRIPA